MAKGRKPIKLTEIVNASEVEPMEVVQDTEFVETKEAVTPIKSASGHTYVPQGLKVQTRDKATGRIISMSVDKKFAEQLCKQFPHIEIV